MCGIGKALDELTGGTDAHRELEVFTPPERSREAIMGPKGGAGPSPPPEKNDGERVDFVLTLGGDGLLMYSNTLFRVRGVVMGWNDPLCYLHIKFFTKIKSRF